MIFNSTYHNDDTEELINDIVGQPFSWLKRFKLGGVGSKRMIVKTCSLSSVSLKIELKISIMAILS